jgi:hypothetical protein
MDAEKKKAAVFELFGSRKNLLLVREAIGTAVRGSFLRERVMRRVVLLNEQPTDTETRRRVNICYDWLIVLKGDMRYSTRKACAVLPHALQATLDGQQWEPPPAEQAYSA